jgi:hypothetical protein
VIAAWLDSRVGEVRFWPDIYLVASVPLSVMKMSPHTFNIKAHESRLDVTIAQSFSTSFMSNSKWRRFFLALAEVDPRISTLRWKFVGRDIPPVGAAPDDECLGDKYISRTSFAVFPYKEIEWVELPGITALPAAVAAVGKFEIVQTPGGVRVLGYR